MFYASQPTIEDIYWNSFTSASFKSSRHLRLNGHKTLIKYVRVCVWPNDLYCGMKILVIHVFWRLEHGRTMDYKINWHGNLRKMGISFDTRIHTTTPFSLPKIHEKTDFSSSVTSSISTRNPVFLQVAECLFRQPQRFIHAPRDSYFPIQLSIHGTDVRRFSGKTKRVYCRSKTFSAIHSPHCKVSLQANITSVHG